MGEFNNKEMGKFSNGMKRELALPITILLAYGLAIGLNASFKQPLSSAKAQADIIERMFGSFRVFVGDLAFMKAEEYHHRGLPFEEALAYHAGESILSERERRKEPSGAHAGERGTTKAPAGLYLRLYSQVKVTGDSHLKPEEEKEVLPWFYIETAFNPHDIRGYVLGSYWLERVGRSEESFKFLREGEKNNPDSAQILSAFGEAYSKKADYEKAAMYLERSCRLWMEARGVNKVSNRYEESDRLFAFDLLASLYLRKGDRAKAVDIYTELLKFGPNPAIVDKLRELEKKP